MKYYTQEIRDALRGPLQVSLDITNKCNYKCLHCYNASGENSIVNDEMSDAEIIALCKEIGEIKPQNFCFCGGEPLIKAELLIKCANILHEAGVPAIATVSNGYYLTEDLLRKMCDAHFKSIQISLDGFSEHSCCSLRQNPKAFEKAVAAIQLLSKYRDYVIPSVAFCPTKWNISEFEQVYRFCDSLSVPQLRVQPLMIIGRASKNLEAIMPSDSQYIQLIHSIHNINLKNAKERGPQHTFIEWGDPLDHIYRLKNTDVYYTLSMAIKANGDIAVSPYMPIVVGSVRKHSLTEYWNAGYAKVWQLNPVQQMANELYSVDKMSGAGLVENSWFDQDIKYDIIEHREQLDDFTND